MENTTNTKEKIKHKITEGSVSASFGIILILIFFLLAGWYAYEKYRDEGVIKPLFGEDVPDNSYEEVLYEDSTGGVVTTVIIEEE